MTSQLQKLGSLKGLSVMRSGNEPPTANANILDKVSKTSMGDLSTQLEKRKSKEDMIAELKDAKKVGSNPKYQNWKTSVQQNIQVKNKSLLNSLPKQLVPNQSLASSFKNRSDDDNMKALLKSSLPKNFTKPVVAEAAMSPAMQRKLLFEKLAEDEKLKETKKSRRAAKILPNDDVAKRPKPSDQTEQSNTRKLVEDSISLLNKPIKKEPIPNIGAQKEIFPQELTKKKSNHRAPLVLKIKQENVAVDDDLINDPLPSKAFPTPPQVQPPPPPQALPSSSSTSLTADQVKILSSQFVIKDYLSRKEMRSLAIKSNLTDAQVRDWFKARRVEEDTPLIVDEKQSDVQLANSTITVKQEPVDEDVVLPTIDSVVQNAVANVNVKQEPEDEPDSAVLDPMTGKLLKKSNVDKKLEDILAKASLLDSLTKKIELVNKPVNKSKDKMKNQLGDIIDILDDDIEITKENIVNPGPKEKPLAKVLNKFLTQVEQLEKSMGVNEFSKNIEIETIVKENSRKQETISDLEIEVNEKRKEVVYLSKELNDKNDEIESILLNSVSKETFIRTQFQSLTSEVRKLKQEKADITTLNEKIRELEVKLRKKSHDTEDLKLKYDSAQGLLNQKDKDIRDLEEMSTKMIGDITKGIGEKLAVAKKREQELKTTLEKNETLEFDLKELGLTFKQQNEDLIRIRAEEKEINLKLSVKCGDLAKSVIQKDDEISTLKNRNERLTLINKENVDAIKYRDEEIDRLKEQVSSLTKRFRNKVKEIQETLSNYNETLKSKNTELVTQAEEIIVLKEQTSNQVEIIKKLKDTDESYIKEVAHLKLSLTENKTALEEYKVVKKSKSVKRKFSSDLVEEVHMIKRVALKHSEQNNPNSSELQLPSPLLFLARYPSSISLQLAAPPLSIGYNWPLVSYRPASILHTGQATKTEDESPVVEAENKKDTPAIEGKSEGGKRKKQLVVQSSRKRFRLSAANRPVSNLRLN